MHDDSKATDDPNADAKANEPEAPDEGAEAASPTQVQGEQLLRRGTPVFGRDDSRLGELTRDGDEGGVLMMRRDASEPEITLPEGVLSSIEPDGVYTNLTWSDLDALLPPPVPGSEEALRDAFGTGAEAAHANRFEDDEPS